MRFMMSCVMLISLSAPAMAGELPFKNVACGDHWFTVHATVDAATSSAVVWYSGDSVSQQVNMQGVVTVDESDVVITYIESSSAQATQMQLVIDTFDAIHDLFWGNWGKVSALSAMGLCDAE